MHAAAWLARLLSWKQRQSRRHEGCGLVVHDAVQVSGFGAEIAASTAQVTGCQIHRLGAPRIPVGYSPTLEDQTRITVEAIEKVILQLTGKKRGK
jgi:pyruvate dehydrogenase E1 component beta subunit